MLHKLFLTTAVLAMCTLAQASDTDWSWRFNGAYFGTRTAAVDGFDALDQRISQAAATYCGTYHERNLAGWAGDTGFYATDLRAPMPLVPGQSKTWTFFLWEDPAWNIVLELGWGWNSAATPAFNKMTYVLTYVRAAEGIAGGPAVGTSAILNQQQQGTWSFPVYKTTDGRTGYMFTLTATVIPESSSLAAILAGLAGLGAVVRRRRR